MNTTNPMYTIKLKIADIIIQMRSRFPLQPLDKQDGFRFRHFIYEGDNTPHIHLEINPVRTLPLLNNSMERIFLTRHSDTNEINWGLYKNKNHYILRQYISKGRQFHKITDDFSKVKAYLLKNKKDKLTWKLTEVIYDALQVILIHYISQRDGIFIHAVGVKDDKKDGLLFVGKSGQGKTTQARIWHKYSKAKVLNDDRIILRKINNRFFIYGSPWHGDFSDYLASKTDRARLKNIFFIYHARKHQANPLKKGLFELLYPCLFPTFWDKQGLEKITTICDKLLKNISCFRLGFRKDRSVIGFVRNIK